MDSQAAEEASDSADNEESNAGLEAKLTANIPFSISPEQIPRVVPPNVPKRDYQKLAFWLAIAIFCVTIIAIALYVSSLRCEDLIKCSSNFNNLINSTFNVS